MMKKVNLNTIYIILSVLLLVQTGLLFAIFGKFKQGFHSDEVFNYGFANKALFEFEW